MNCFIVTKPNFLLWIAILVFSFQNLQAVEKQTQEKPQFDLTMGKVLYVTGYAHLDTQWRWDYVNTINECIKNTLCQNFEMFQKYPDYVINFTGSARYKMMKEYYPVEYEKLKYFIKQQRWFVSGSSVDEGDALIPSPESIIRQVLYGNDYFRKEFGIESYDYMLPDCFGFPYTMPSILSHCGILGFSTQKLIWNCAQGIPFNIGMWEGPDGNAIMAALNPGHYNDSIKTAPDKNSIWENRIEMNGKKYGIFADYHYYGIGDRGGSIRESDVNNYTKAVKLNNGKYKLYLTSSDRLFRDVNEDQKKKLPRYKGEFLLIEHSAGSLTSAAYMKRWNRKNEQIADAAERSAVMADWIGSRQYPLEKLNLGWYRVLGSQMHDILPGTCVPTAYDYAYNDELIGLNIFASVLEDSAGAFVSGMDTTGDGKSIIVYNPLTIARTEIVEAKVSYNQNVPKFVEVINFKGNKTPSQILKIEGNTVTVLFVASVPPIGFSVYDLRTVEKASAFDTGLRISDSEVENHIYKVKVDENGDIISIYDKRAKREILSGPARLAFLHESPTEWPAWNMDWKDRQKNPVDYVSGPAKIRIVENGPVRVSLAIERQRRNSFFTQFVRLSCDERANIVEVKNEVDWQSSGVCLKAQFPLTVNNPFATYTMGLGTIERGNNEPNKYEVPSHEWFDLTDKTGKYGVSVIEDCKYGSDKPNDNTVRLTLLYTPQTEKEYYLDQGTQDWGRHEFIYGIYGHEGNWRQAGSYWQGRRLNQPLRAFQSNAHKGPFGKQFSMVNVSSDHVEITALKKAENSVNYIIRVQEISGKPVNNLVLSIGNGITWAAQVDGQEREIGHVELKNGRLLLNMKANNICSFSIRLENSKFKLPLPQCQTIKLVYDTDVLSNDSNSANGAMDCFGRTIPAELLPDKLVREGIQFQLGSGADGQKNAVKCLGQKIQFPDGDFNRVYLLACADEDANGMFKLGNNKVALRIYGWTGFVGQYDRRRWSKSFSEVDYVGQARPEKIETGFIKRCNIGWFCTHRHGLNGNEAYQFSYIYKYRLDLNGAKSIVLPENPKIKLFALTVVHDQKDDIRPVTVLYDDFSHRSLIELRKMME